ncbi:MAG TPA: exopolysaccharide biosynthesis polyprenyl glycosylphosphotransferase [Solirubrobacterales bacterium]|nr:exopolysaccharide biosynthesis polyprenyl glycosylphosphotransferase [Solirubrobacterales bacterium]
MSGSLLSRRQARPELPTAPVGLPPAPPFEERNLESRDRRRREVIRRREAVYKRALAVADLCAVGVALVAGALILGEDSLTIAGTIAALLLVVVVMKTLGLYDRDEHLLHKSTLDELPGIFEVATVSALLLWLCGDLIVDGDIGRRQVIGIWGLLIVLFLVFRSIARSAARRLTQPERCLVLGDADAAEAFRSKVEMDRSINAALVAWLPAEVVGNGGGSPPVLSIPANLDSVLAEEQVHRIVLSPGRLHNDALIHAVRSLSAHGVSVSVLPANPQVHGSAVELDDVHGLTLLGVRSFEMTRSSRILKRGFDLALSLLLLIVLSALFLLAALAIRLDSKGPVFYRQRRIGRDGEPFEMFKFRSMFDGAHEQRESLRSMNEADGLFKIAKDPRVTRVGRYLRRWSLDELPQLLNVLRGEMSLVGPRPLIPEEDSQIEGLYRRRLDLAPGMTGHWQTLGSSRIPLFEMVRLDYLYVANWSLWNDLRLLLRTIPHVFSGKGI